MGKSLLLQAQQSKHINEDALLGANYVFAFRRFSLSCNYDNPGTTDTIQYSFAGTSVQQNGNMICQLQVQQRE